MLLSERERYVNISISKYSMLYSTERGQHIKKKKILVLFAQQIH